MIAVLALVVLLASTLGPAVYLLVRDLRSGQYPTWEEHR